MIFKEIFHNNLEIIASEIFLAITILVLLLYGTFTVKSLDNEKNLNIKSVNNLTLFFLFYAFLLLLNTKINNSSILLLNGTFIFDEFSQFVKLIIILSLMAVIIIQKEYINEFKLIRFEYTVLYLTTLLGLMLLVSSYNFISFYLAIELISLSSYILAASQKKSVFSTEAALKYFVLGAIGSGFILFGSSLIYLYTGSLNFGTISLIFSNISDLMKISGALYGFIFLLAGILFKIGAAPFHMWLPDVYEGSPNNITALFSIVPKIAFIGILIRLFFDTFHHVSVYFENIIYISCISSLLIGSIATLRQKKIKRLMAYSSISHVGYILLAFVSNNLMNIQYIIFYLIIYILMTVNLWIVFISLRKNNRPVKYITDLTNLLENNKMLTMILVFTLFSMMGIPPFAGFFSKFFIIYSAVNGGYFGLALFAILLSTIGAFYYLRLIKIMCFDKNDSFTITNTLSTSSTILLSLNTVIISCFFLYTEEILVLIENKCTFLFI